VRFRDLIIYTPFFNANLTDPAPVFAFQLPTMGHIGAKKCYSARWALQCRALVGSGEVTRYTFGDPRQAAPGQLVITGPSAAVQYSCFIAYFERLQIAVVSTPVPISGYATSWSWISRAAQTCRCGQNGKRLNACRHETRYLNASVESMATWRFEGQRMGSNNSPALGCWVTKFHKPARSATPHGSGIAHCGLIAAARAQFRRYTLSQTHSRRA